MVVHYNVTIAVFELWSHCTGARVDLKDKEKNTSLHIAARNGHASVVKTLISYCADIMK